jgi:hypothetical protein
LRDHLPYQQADHGKRSEIFLKRFGESRNPTTPGAQEPENPKKTQTKSRSRSRDRFLVSGFFWVFGSLRVPGFCLTLEFSKKKSTATFFSEKYFSFFFCGFGSAHTGGGRRGCGFLTSPLNPGSPPLTLASLCLPLTESGWGVCSVWQGLRLAPASSRCHTHTRPPSLGRPVSLQPPDSLQSRPTPPAPSPLFTSAHPFLLCYSPSSPFCFCVWVCVCFCVCAMAHMGVGCMTHTGVGAVRVTGEGCVLLVACCLLLVFEEWCATEMGWLACKPPQSLDPSLQKRVCKSTLPPL